MSVDLSQWPRVIYAKNPLSVVVLQARFSPILSLTQPAGVAPFQARIRETYPRAEAPGTQFTVVIGPLGPMPSQAVPGPWKFHDDKGWLVALSTDYVSVETTQYTRYEDLRARAAHVLEAAREVLDLREMTRLGLRYVNEIRHPEAATLADWRRLLNRDLLGVAGGELLGPDVVQTLQQIDVRLGEGVLTVRHGWREADAGGPPSPYAIDLDAHIDETRPFDVPATLKRCDEFNASIGGFFRQSLAEELVAYLGPTEPGE